MTKVFVDTNALIALKNKADNLHNEAVTVQNRLVIEQRQFVTTNAVLLELCNALSTPDLHLRQISIDLVNLIQNSNK